MNTVRVQVPATSANCGPGFDCLGLALNLYNIFSFTPDVNATEYTYTFEGFGADILRAEDPKKNLIGFAMDQVFATAQEPIQYGQITSETLIPPSRGLGSSSTAIVGGLLLANALGYQYLYIITALVMVIALSLYHVWIKKYTPLEI